MIDIDAIEEIKRLKEMGKTIVVTNGVFDLLHVGHLRCLEEAKLLGDILVVFINSDTSTKKLKGEFRPIFNENERAEMLLGFHCVDFVIIFDEPNIESYLKDIVPHVYIKGHDYNINNTPEKELLESLNIKLKFTGDTKNHSSTEILKKINEL